MLGTPGLASYASDHGLASGWPYFPLDGVTPVTARAWDDLRTAGTTRTA